MDSAVKEFVRQRAKDCCEYCRIQQRFYPDFTFHVEHIIARQHGGSNSAENLAFACHLCNSKKGPNLSGIDPDSGEMTRLFNPRRDGWSTHFRLDQSGEIKGLTAIGRTTVVVLGMNADLRVQIRREVAKL